jgi:hypothetical protein
MYPDVQAGPVEQRVDSYLGAGSEFGLELIPEFRRREVGRSGAQLAYSLQPAGGGGHGQGLIARVSRASGRIRRGRG